MLDDIANNAAEFGEQLQDVLKNMTGDTELALKKAAVDLFRLIAERTPVDTGRAKANWSIDKIEHNRTEDVGDSTVASKANDFFRKWNIQDKQIVILNNLEYIEFLENGSSQQAPAGMVSVSFKDFADIFRREADKIRGGQSS